MYRVEALDTATETWVRMRAVPDQFDREAAIGCGREEAGRLRALVRVVNERGAVVWQSSEEG